MNPCKLALGLEPETRKSGFSQKQACIRNRKRRVEKTRERRNYLWVSLGVGLLVLGFNHSHQILNDAFPGLTTPHSKGSNQCVMDSVCVPFQQLFVMVAELGGAVQTEMLRSLLFLYFLPYHNP